MDEWLLILRKEDRHTLGAVRCLAGVMAAADDNAIYLRGNSDDTALRQLPVQHSYRIEQGLLFPQHGVTPVGRVPDPEWVPIATFIPAEMPVAAMPARSQEKQPVALVASGKPKETVALLTGLQQWKDYAATAPQVRLSPLRFAVSEKDEVLIVGNPLPPLPGRTYWQHERILMPAGYDFETEVLTRLLPEIMPVKDAYLLFDTDSSCELIPGNSFVAATRSAVRLTLSNI